MNWFWIVCGLVLSVSVCMLQIQASIIEIKAISPDVAVLSGNRNKGNGLWKNSVGGNQDSRTRIETTETGGAGQSDGGGGGGLLGGLL